MRKVIAGLVWHSHSRVMLVNHQRRLWPHSSRDILVVKSGDATNISCIERGQDGAKHPAVRKTVSRAKSDPAGNINRAEVEKHCSRGEGNEPTPGHAVAGSRKGRRNMNQGNEKEARRH